MSVGQPLNGSRAEPLQSSIRRAFTLLEVMLAIAIFSMILLSIYSIWTGILKATKATRTAADAAQYARVSMRTFETAIFGVQMFTANMFPMNRTASYYTFLADTSGDNTKLSFVSHLPPTFPGASLFPDHPVRRVTFSVEGGPDGSPSLVMRQVPMMESVLEDAEAHSLVLAKDVQFFYIRFWGQHRETRNFEWLDEWNSTNTLPRMIQVALGTGKDERNADVTYRVVALPATAVDPQWQMPGAVGVQQPPPRQ